jgi:hypothetical protein
MMQRKFMSISLKTMKLKTGEVDGSEKARVEETML